MTVAEYVLERDRSRPAPLGGVPRWITASVGIACFDNERVLSSDEVIAAAERALAEAKHRGRDRAVSATRAARCSPPRRPERCAEAWAGRSNPNPRVPGGSAWPSRSRTQAVKRGSATRAAESESCEASGAASGCAGIWIDRLEPGRMADDVAGRGAHPRVPARAGSAVGPARVPAQARDHRVGVARVRVDRDPVPRPWIAVALEAGRVERGREHSGAVERERRPSRSSRSPRIRTTRGRRPRRRACSRSSSRPRSPP